MCVNGGICSIPSKCTFVVLKASGVGEESYEAMLYLMLLRALPREFVLKSSMSGGGAAGAECFIHGWQLFISRISN